MDKEYEIIDNIIYTPPINHEIDRRGIGWYFFDKLKQNKNRLAQIDGLTGEEETFGVLLQRCIRAAIGLKSNGIGYGDVVSVCSYNHKNTCVPHISSMFVGAKIAAFDPSLSLPDATHLFKIVMPKLIFLGLESVELFEEVIKKVGSTTTTVIVFGPTDKYTPFSDFSQPHADEILFNPIAAKDIKDVCVIFFSSGTSGLPKGICHTHYSILNAHPTSFKIGPVPILLITDSPYWNVYLFNLYHCIANGVARIFYPKFYSEDPWKVFSRKVSMCLLNVTNTMMLANCPKPEFLDINEFKVFITAGSPISKRQIDKTRAAFPDTLVVITYGQSEVFTTITCFDVENPQHVELMKAKPTSCGLPKTGVSYKIVDVENENVLGANEVGEIRVKTELQLSGYYKMESNDIWDADGWLKTGDYGYYDEDCCFYIVDRVKETFKYQGWHIVPAILEDILETHPAVYKAVVIGVPHEDDEHHPMAFVQLHKNAKNVTEDEIIKHLEERVEDRQRLRGGVRFIDSIPLTPTNKIYRQKLKKMAF